MDTESRYLTEGVIPNIGATGILLENVTAVLEEFNSINSIKVVLVDNTSTNTDCKTSFVTAWRGKKKKLKRKLHTIDCSLHQNKFPFRTVSNYTDEITRSPTTFTEPLGKLCRNNYQDFPQVEFNTISGPLDILLQRQWDI